MNTRIKTSGRQFGSRRRFSRASALSHLGWDGCYSDKVAARSATLRERISQTAAGESSGVTLAEKDRCFARRSPSSPHHCRVIKSLAYPLLELLSSAA